ncbi:MAG: hypothetical protein ACI9XZ_004167 [Alphaproteobacteria bacterium]|jgi:hypothetical protein
MGRKTEAADRTVKDIRRQTRKQYSSEEKIRAGLRGEDSIAELSEEMQRLHALLHQRAMYCGS